MLSVVDDAAARRADAAGDEQGPGGPLGCGNCAQVAVLPVPAAEPDQPQLRTRISGFHRRISSGNTSGSGTPGSGISCPVGSRCRTCRPCTITDPPGGVAVIVVRS